MALDQTYHYTVQDIERYLNGSMTAQEMHDMERAALTDLFLADAIDGLRSAKPDVTAKHLNEINAQIGNLQPRETPVVKISLRQNNFKRWAAAATVAGVLGLSAWLLMRDGTVIKNNEVAKTEIPVLADSAAASGAALDEAKTETAESVTDTSIDVLEANASKPKPNKIEESESAMQTDAAQKNQPKFPVEANSFPGESDATKESEDIATVPQTKDNKTFMQQPADSLNNQSQIYRGRAQTQQAATMMKNERYKSAAPNSFSGQITDENGKPVPGASIVAGNLSAVSNLNGSFYFSLPGVDSLPVYVSAVGYNNKRATLIPGSKIGILMEPSTAHLDEVVVVGFGKQKKRAAVGSIRDLKVDTLEATEYPYPDGGWESFYDDIASDVGINRTKADKLLHLKFMIENGAPTNFTIIKTPSKETATKVITAIKKGPRWKNFRKRRNAEVKMKVE